MLLSELSVMPSPVSMLLYTVFYSARSESSSSRHTFDKTYPSLIERKKEKCTWYLLNFCYVEQKKHKKKTPHQNGESPTDKSQRRRINDQPKKNTIFMSLVYFHRNAIEITITRNRSQSILNPLFFKKYWAV